MSIPRHVLCIIAMSTTAVACGAARKSIGDLGPDAGPGDVAGPWEDTGPIPSCAAIDDAAPVVVATAADADEYGLVLTAQSQSATSWSTAGNEAVVLEVSGGGGRLVGHLVLHQGAAAFDYGMQLGALAAGEPVAVKVSSLSAASAVHRACVVATLTPAAAMGAAAEGLIHAPIFRWPRMTGSASRSRCPPGSALPTWRSSGSMPTTTTAST